jgi:hypothetical protein
MPDPDRPTTELIHYSVDQPAPVKRLTPIALLADAARAAAAHELAMSRVQEVIRGASTEALAVTARIVAAGEQPTTQLAVELVRAEAALARVRAVLEHWGVPAGPEVGFAEDFAESIHESGAWRLARDLRAALDGSSGA